jgi:superfamily II DNA or RNA helicase
MDGGNTEGNNKGSENLRKINIRIINNIWAVGDRNDLDVFTDCLYFNDIRVKQGTFNKEFIEQKYPVFVKTKKFGSNLIGIYTGLLPRLKKFCKEKGYLYNCDTIPIYPKFQFPELPQVTFSDGRKFEKLREDQIYHINRACLYKRGILQGFTGMGKSLLAMGLMYSHLDSNILFLAHTTGLISQLADDMRDFKCFDFTEMYGTKKQRREAKIWLSTRQTMARIVEELGDSITDKFDVVICDESHHLSSFNGEYAEILTKLNAPVRIGLTATVPKDYTRKRLAMESFLGPVLAEFTIQEGSNLELLAEPRICIRKVPFSAHVKNLRKYPEVYEHGVKFNEAANLLKVNDAAELVANDLSVLVFVTNIDHGEQLQRMLRDKLNCFVPFIKGAISTENRDTLKESMKKKEVKCIIANVVWREGINIPSLDVMINASSSKEEIQTLQTAGRGLRKTSEKSEVLIVDYFDNSHYFLTSHFGERLSTYMNEGWEFMSIKEFIKRRKEK